MAKNKKKSKNKNKKSPKNNNRVEKNNPKKTNSNNDWFCATGITKRFPGVLALNNVNFSLQKGEIHSICGENGAGKSTLIKTLSGIYAHDTYEGDLSFEGEKLALRSLRDAENLGINVIYQELALVEDMTVAENIFLGREPTTFGLVDWYVIYHEARQFFKHFNIDIDPTARLGDLGVGQQQLVEIVKALSKKSNILILDEPTSALTEKEVKILLGILVYLRAQGISSVYISHKLDEVFAISDRITVLRDGETVITLDAKKTNQKEIIHHMVGREIKDLFPRRTSETGETLLEVQNLDASHRAMALKNINFSLKSGEVLGIGGLMGAGRTELLMHIFGAWGKRTQGQVKIRDKVLQNNTPADSIQNGLVLVSEDRKLYGLILDKDIRFNISLSSLVQLTKLFTIDHDKEIQWSQQYFDSLRVKAPSLESIVEHLSGGNQQKVVLGKALMTKPQIIFLDEPTRGIDVGAKLEVYELINQLTSEGHGVVLVSSELPELVGMSDRIIMLHEGTIGGTFEDDKEVTQEQLMAAAMGKN